MLLPNDPEGAPFAFDFDTAYKARDWGEGIAWRAYAYATEPDKDTDWTGLEIPTGQIIAYMIGDDRDFYFDPDELEPIDADAYCPECGQTGCRAYAYEEEL